MGFLAGALLGVGVQTFSNALRKLPLARGPLEHVAFGLAGGVAGYYYSNWAEQNTAEYLKTVERYEASTRSQANPTQ